MTLAEETETTIELSSPLVERSFEVDGDRLRQSLTIAGVAHASDVAVTDQAEANHDPLGAWWHAYFAGERAWTPRRGSVRTVELFCGPGGLALGFGQACAELGLEVRSMAAADQDEEALAIYRQRNQTRLVSKASVSQLVDHRVKGRSESCRFAYDPEMVDPEWEELVDRVDVLLAGPPCQGHSNLNNVTRRVDKRNELYLTVPAIALALRVPMVIIENVRAVVHDRGQVVQSTVALLEDAGYVVEQGVVKAADLGWPQRRERYFLIARRADPPLPLAEVTSGLSADPHDVSWAFADLHTRSDDFMTARPELSVENQRRIDWLFDNAEYDLANSERPECHQDGTTYNSVYGRLYPDRPAPTITTGFMTPGRGRYIHPAERRVINAREAARLQGFPDHYSFRPDPPNDPSKQKLAKWIGDAVPMPLGYVAGLSVLGRASSVPD
jgi:DNA (cytosine-5)-methyltransferase 1